MATGKLEYKKVIALTRPHKDRLLALKFEGEHAAIRATPAQPFWIERAGHAPAWITAGKIRIGDEVLTEKGQWEKVTGDWSTRQNLCQRACDVVRCRRDLQTSAA